METSSSNSVGDHAGPQMRSKDPSIFCFCTLLGTPAVSSEAGSTIFGFPGISGGKVPIRSCLLKVLTLQAWEPGPWRSEVHIRRGQGSRAKGEKEGVF